MSQISASLRMFDGPFEASLATAARGNRLEVAFDSLTSYDSDLIMGHYSKKSSPLDLVYC